MKRHSAFTLIELLVVVAIIVVLIAILMPSLNRARQQAKSVQCLSNVKQLGTGFFMYAQENNDHLPLNWASASIASVSNPTFQSDARAISEWNAGGVPGGPTGIGRLLPYMGFTSPLTHAGITNDRPKYMVCPAVGEYDSAQPTGSLVYSNFTDYVYWRDGLTPDQDPYNPWAHLGGKLNTLNDRCLTWCIAAGNVEVRIPGGHMDGSSFLFGDGHAEYLKRSQYTAYQAGPWAWWEEDTHWRH